MPYTGQVMSVTQFFLSSFANDTELIGGVDTTDTCASIQKDLEKLENWTNEHVKCNIEKSKVPHLGRKKPRHQHTLCDNQMKSSFVEKDLGLLLATW